MFGCDGKNNKRGSITVFFCMIIVSMMAAVILVVQLADRRCSASYLDGILTLAGRSILSEYDIKLKEDYGIFAFRATEETTREKLGFYLSENQGEGLVSYEAESVELSVDLDDYCICDPDALEEQIVTASVYALPQRLMKARQTGTASATDRILRNESIIGSLPSVQISGSGFQPNFSFVKGDTDLRALIPQTGHTLLRGEYVIERFGNRLKQPLQRDGFFQNETEYVISGQLSDAGNAEKVKEYIVNIRTPINIAKIYADPERLAQATATATAAAAATGGTATAAAIFAIVLTWAVADSKKEADVLIGGGTVDGLDYEKYLLIFLCLSDRETVLLRIADLIQINLKGSYYDGFLLSEHFAGVRLQAECMGKRYEYAQQY